MKYNFIDLFAGCGGLSEGFYRHLEAEQQMGAFFHEKMTVMNK